MAPSVEALGAIRFPGGIAAAGDDWQGPSIFDLLTDFFTVVDFVGGDGKRWSWRFEQLANDLAVVDLPTGHDEFSGRPLLSTSAWILVERPPRLMPIA